MSKSISAPDDLPIQLRLHLFHCITEFHVFQSFQQTVSIFCYAQIPLAQFLFYYRISAAFTYSIDHFIIGQYCSQCFTPVYFTIAQ